MLSCIVQEIKSAKFYTVMADEVTSHNSEQLALAFVLLMPTTTSVKSSLGSANSSESQESILLMKSFSVWRTFYFISKTC